MKTNSLYPKAYVNVNKLINNAETVKGLLSNEKFYAVVKADGYGHGYKVAEYLEKIVDGFVVSRVYEGVSLRYLGIKKPIMCLLPPEKDEIVSAINYDLQISFEDENALFEIISICHKKKAEISVHMAVDTGMNRMGFSRLDSFEQAISIAKNDKYIKIKSCYSHFYNSQSVAACEKQNARFNNFEKVFLNNIDGLTHISASGGFIHKKFNHNLVRIGLLLYGYKPFKAEIIVNPIMEISGGFYKQKFFNGSEIALYNEKPVGIFGLANYGYADGLFRKRTYHSPNKCMDLGYYPVVMDEVKIMTDAEALAKENKTIPYEILVNATRRIEKVYVKDNL